MTQAMRTQMQDIGAKVVAMKNCLQELADPKRGVTTMKAPHDEFEYVFVFYTRGDLKEVVIRIDVRAVDRAYMIRTLADTHRAIQKIRENGRQKVLAEVRTGIADGVKKASNRSEVVH